MPTMDDRPIRGWLEPGYDYGRFGAWALDLPGCATWADDRAAALASVPGAVSAFGAWLVRHGLFHLMVSFFATWRQRKSAPPRIQG